MAYDPQMIKLIYAWLIELAYFFDRETKELIDAKKKSQTVAKWLMTESTGFCWVKV